MEAKVKVVVRGWVQGIGYRAFVSRYAKMLGLKGYVKNLPNRKEVEAVFVGDEKRIEKMIWIMRNKHPLARVETVRIEEYNGKEKFDDFRIIR